jgi:hypothetical protein
MQSIVSPLGLIPQKNAFSTLFSWNDEEGGKVKLGGKRKFLEIDEEGSSQGKLSL